MSKAQTGNMAGMITSINAMEDSSEQVVIQIDRLMDEIVADK